FYTECSVLQAESPLKEERLALVKATQIVLHNAFELIGVSAPEKM
ncbi:MAG: DALR anticodon-binding domain-containing protein, partial [Erysipelotrichaceae bacterium]